MRPAPSQVTSAKSDDEPTPPISRYGPGRGLQIGLHHPVSFFASPAARTARTRRHEHVARPTKRFAAGRGAGCLDGDRVPFRRPGSRGCSGPEAYGILGFGTAFVSYFALAVVFGTDLYGTREIASSPEKMPALLSRIMGARLILLLLVGVIYIGVISGIDRPRDVIIVMFIQILGLLSAAMTVDFLFQGVQRMGPVAIRQGAAALAGMIAVLIVVRDPGDVFAAAAIRFPQC